MENEALEDRKARKLWSEYLKKDEEASMLFSEAVRVRKEAKALYNESKQIFAQLDRPLPDSDSNFKLHFSQSLPDTEQVEETTLPPYNKAE